MFVSINFLYKYHMRQNKLLSKRIYIYQYGNNKEQLKRVFTCSKISYQSLL